jgi:hypothetical protein
MAASPLVPNDRDVYRGMRNPSWSKRGVVSHLAFMLRPATADFPIEQDLSLGLTIEAAIDELREHYGIAELSVLAIHELPHGLTVRSAPNEPSKADLFGLPLYSTEEYQRDLAVTMAKDLATLAHLVPSNPLPQ